MKFQKFNKIYEIIIESISSKSKCNKVDDEITEDGECGAAGSIGSGDSGVNANGAGLTSNSVFGSGDSAFDSIYNDSEKDPAAPGLTTYDMIELYTPSMGRKKLKEYPLFKRVTKKKQK